MKDKMQQSLTDIINRGKSNQASEKERQEMLSLFHQPDIEYEMKDLLLSDLNHTEASSLDKDFSDELFEKWWNRRKPEKKATLLISLFSNRIAQIAAILLIGLLLGVYINSIHQSSSPVFYTSFARKGSISEMLLPDGTHIFLNSGSEIKYSVDGKNGIREIFLNGEAWFEVAKMKHKPFLVHTSIYDVKVLGTTFNIKAYDDGKELITTLEEGKIQVLSSEKHKLTKDIVLTPGQQLSYNVDSREIKIHDVNTKWFTSWKDNKLVFINMSLKDLKVLLERKYGVDIEIVDQSILKYHYDGTIKNETVLEALELLKHTLPIKYEIVGQKIIIDKK
jgi:transmembrane sensor